MGKSTKPRVKGNLKPASSSRAAELASSSRSLSFENLGGFAQFVGNAPSALPSSRPSTPSSETFHTVDLDPELVVILKKVSKRDVTTKLKALEELENYLQSNTDSIQLVLNNWVTMYNKLVLEVDRRVRLVANQVHALITAHAKKKLAPVLKELIGPWLLSMYDSSKDVVKVAQGAFETVFAADKRLGAISFCQKEILDYITDMLLYKTPETLSDVRYVNKEDMLAKYARVISSSLQILSYLIQSLPDKLTDAYEMILDDSTMWKRLSTNESALIRKAFYNFICTLLMSWIETIESRLDLICPCFYASVFNEKDVMTHSVMWDALLLMTKKLPQSWIIIGKKKPALPKLYHFLRSGLNGSPNIAYPSMLALLAHLPEELKTTTNFYTDVFDNFWKGLNTEYIDKSNSHLFLNAYAECIVYFAITLSKTNQEDDLKIATTLIEQTFFNMIQSYFLSIKSFEKLDLNGYAIIAKHLVVISSAEQISSLVTFWSQLDDLLVQTLVDCGTKLTKTPLDMDFFCQKVGHFMTALSYEISQRSKQTKDDDLQIQDLTKRLLLTSIESALVHKRWAPHLLVLAQQLVVLLDRVDMTKEVERLLSLLKLPEGNETLWAAFAGFYVTYVGRDDEGSMLWTALMNTLRELLNDTSELTLSGAQLFVLVLQQGPKKEGTRCDALDAILEQTWHRLLQPESTNLGRPLIANMLSAAFSQPHLFSETTTKETIHSMASVLTDYNRQQEDVSTSLLETTQTILNILQNSSTGLLEVDSDEWIGPVFDAMFVVSPIAESANAVWDLYKNHAKSDRLVERVKQSMTDVQYAASPSDNVRRIKTLLTTYPDTVTVDIILGTEQEWRTLAGSLLLSTNDLTLTLTDPFVGLMLNDNIKTDSESVTYDLYGLSEFARLAFCWGEYLFSSDNEMHHVWLMRQLMMTVVRCEQGLMSSGLQCGLWQTKAVEGVRTFVQTMLSVFTAWLSRHAGSIDDVNTWNTQVLKTVEDHTAIDSVNQPLLRLVVEFMVTTTDSDEIMTAHVLQLVLQQLVVLLDWPVEAMAQWIPFLKPADRRLSLAHKMAIVKSFKSSLNEEPGFVHYQSELASRLSNISQLKDLKTHWDDVVLLNASVLKHGALNMPRQRLMYLVQSLRPLLASLKDSDDDDDDDTSSRTKALLQAQLAQLLKHLAESIPDVSGSHWDDFVDCCFEWIAFADTLDAEELVVAYHGLDLLRTLMSMDFVEEVIAERMPVLSKCVLDLVAKEVDYYQQTTAVNKARMVYQTLLADLLDFVPEKSLIEHCDEYFSKFVALIHSPNEVLQKRVYLVLKTFVAHQVQELSVQLEFTQEEETQQQAAEINHDILNAVLNPPDLSQWQSIVVEDALVLHHETLGYLLSWMLMLDHFMDITFRLKQEYTAQLKEHEAVSHLMPTLCRILSVGQQGHTTPFDLTPWTITEYDTEGFDVTSEMAFLVLSGHLYYRALTHIPSLVRQWWIDCRHRQLTIAIEQYTEKYFSQTLIQKEMDLVNRDDIKRQLEENEENAFSVKTAKSEVTATYRVDEQDMQIAIKLPTNFPLRPIDVEGLQKIGVNDKQWRGWMFAVTAVIGSQNGNIVDALTVFKRNVNLHFNGVEDCTICYSIISAQDRSIPTKQCRTCKNKFHSSCLYKWFRSSNSASCPLCRTVF
ncbi:MAG: hypothetical protein EXX96DRAFT_622161 [Benjaminiella poitrasii]|nr:MAG: hypothetical protein EXX96DRAFT_622161 [Benjaminiella poitrasii]